MDLTDGVRFSSVSSAVVPASSTPHAEDITVSSEAPGRLRRDPVDAQVYISHSLLRRIFTNNSVVKSFREKCQEEFRDVMYRGRTYELGSEWPVSEDAYTEFKGAPLPTDHWPYNCFVRVFDAHAHRTVCAFMNSVTIYTETVASQASMIFGVHDQTRLIHGIWQKAPADPELQQAQLREVEAALREKLGNRIQGLVAPPKARTLLQSRLRLDTSLVGYQDGHLIFLVLLTLELGPAPLCSCDCTFLKRNEVHPATVPMSLEELKEFGIVPEALAQAPVDEAKDLPVAGLASPAGRARGKVRGRGRGHRGSGRGRGRGRGGVSAGTV